MAVKKTKLGMKVQPPAVVSGAPIPDPYEELSDRTLQGIPEEGRLAQQGQRKIIQTGFPTEIEKSQSKLPKVKPALGKKVTPQA